MKYISTILAVIAIGLVVGVYVYQSRQISALKQNAQGEQKMSGNGFKIAYFEMDSLEAHYDEFKEAQTELNEQDTRMKQTLARLDQRNQKTIEGWRQKQQSNTMTQAEGEEAQRKYQEMQQEFAKTKQDLEQDLYKNTEDKKTKIRKKIEEFLKDYNKQKNYSFIIEYDPNSFIYTKDSLYNITMDLVDGLNTAYKKK